MLIAEIHRLEGNDSLAQVTPSAGGSAEIQENIGLALPVDEDWDNHIPGPFTFPHFEPI
jgi:hypothetical protein